MTYKKLILLLLAGLAISCNDVASTVKNEEETQANATALKNEDNLKLIFGSALDAVQDAIDQAVADAGGGAPSLAPRQDSETYELSGTATLASGGTIVIDESTSTLKTTADDDTTLFVVHVELTMSGIVVAGLSGELSGALTVDASAELDNNGEPIDAVAFTMVGTISTTLSDGTPVELPVEATLTLNTDGSIDYDITIDGETTSFSADGGADSGDAPETTISSGPEGTVDTFDNAFKFACDQAACTFECRLGTGNFEACTSPKSYADQDDGDYAFEVRAVAGSNVDATPAKREYTVDTSPSPGSAPTFSNVGAAGFTIEWEAANDPHSDSADLEYAVYVSTDDDLTVDNADLFGIEVTAWTAAITSATVTGLQSETTYSAYVLVANERDIVAMYPPAQTTTTEAFVYLFNSDTSHGSAGGTSGLITRCENNIPAELTCTKTLPFITTSDSTHTLPNLPNIYTDLPSDVPVRGPNMTLIANNWADMFDGAIENSFITAGVIPSGTWWSGTNSAGERSAETGFPIYTYTCEGWTDNFFNDEFPPYSYGYYGSGSGTSGAWFSAGSSNCTPARYLICACYD